MTDEQIYSVDPRLEHYLCQFIDDGQKYGYDFSKSNIVLLISNSHPYSHGRAHLRSDNIAHVTIDSGLYYREMRLDSVHLKYIIYHELGHAFLRKKHDDKCSSLMYAFQGCSLDRFRIEQQEMIEELFY